MLIDWVTMRVPLEDLDEEALAVAEGIGDRVMRYCPNTGTVRWISPSWDSIRSDSHQVAIRVGTDLWIQGSPARVMGDGDTVFGSGASRAMDLWGCVDRMRRFVAGRLGVSLPAPGQWLVSRVDVTANLELEGLDQVRSALRVLRDVEGGRYRVSQQAGDTVYWSHRSKLRAGKAYAKGPHLTHLMKQSTYEGRHYSDEEIEAAERLLRLELRLGREFWRRNDWRKVGPDGLRDQWEQYFGRMLGAEEVAMDGNVKDRVEAVAPTEGQAKAAYGCWILIQHEGWERAREAYPRRSWYRHLKILREAGLSDADFSVGRLVEFRRPLLEAREVDSWEQLQGAA